MESELWRGIFLGFLGGVLTILIPLLYAGTVGAASLWRVARAIEKAGYDLVVKGDGPVGG